MKLFVAIFFSFVVPWIIGLSIFPKIKHIIVLVAPFACTLGFVFNTIGLDLNYFYPTVSSNAYIHSIGIFGNTGLLPLECCIFIYLIERVKIRTFVLNMLISAISSIIDSLFISFKLLAYDNGWDIYWTFFMYLISFYIVYFYYLWGKKLLINTDFISNSNKS